MKTKLKIACVVFWGMILFLILPCSFVWADESIATSTTIYLDIESATSTLFAGPLTVSTCLVSTSSIPTVNAYCAVKQSGLESEWSAYGDDQFLNSIGGIENDYSNNFYWSWFSNLDYGQTSLSQHILTPDENLLITIGRMPLKLVVSTTTPYFEDVLGLDVLAFGFDTSWNGVWLDAATSSIKNGSDSYQTNDQGHYDLSVSTTTAFILYAQMEGFLPSNSVIIYPLEKLIESATTTATSTPEVVATSTATTTEDDTSSGGGSNNDAVKEKSFDVAKALEFLLSKQKSDGSFGSSLYTDWVAIALSAGGGDSRRSRLISYLKGEEPEMSTVTDYERHAMALMSLNINPYTGTAVNYIEKIAKQFDGVQMGDSSFINDDIFAIFPLINSGYSIDDLIIQKLIEHIISQQRADGSWEGGVDLTAAAIQALSLVSSYEGARASLNMARDYLRSQQQNNGGFGGSFSTSWSFQAITALGESDSDWRKGDNTPESFLSDLQQIDGGIELADTNENTRIWATAYAIPAILHKPWSEILSTFSKQDVLPGNSDDIIEPDFVKDRDLENTALVEDIVLAEPSLIQPDISVLFPFFSNNNLEEKTNVSSDQKSLKELSHSNENNDQIKKSESNIPPLAAVGVNHSKISFNIAVVALLLSGIICLIYFLRPNKKAQ